MLRTSATHPLYLDWAPLAAAPRVSWPGRLGMTILPGKYQRGALAGDHARDLETDAARLAGLGVTTFILLVEDWELDACRVPDFIPIMGRHGIEVLHCPIVDGHTPLDRSSSPRRAASAGRPASSAPGDLAAFVATLAETERRLAAGETLGVSCRGGLGRTGLFVACLLVDGGLDPEQAMAAVRAARTGTIERARQEAFVRAWSLTAGLARKAPGSRL